MSERPAPTFHRAVVTGGAGFVGSHVCEALLRAGTAVVCVDDLSSGAAANVAHLVGDPGFDLVRADITQGPVPLGEGAPRDVDLVLHLASPASPVDYLERPIETLDVGSVGTRHALELAQSCGARFVLASTSEVYGDPETHPQREDYWGHVNPVGPRSVYDEAKRFSEALTTAFRGDRGVDTGIVRIFNTYGPRMRGNDGRMVPTFVRQALAGEPLTVAGDGSQTRSVCYVDDLVEGILAFAASGHTGPMNLGNPEELSVAEVARDVLAATGSTAGTRYVDLPQDDPVRRRPDVSLAREVLGWRARTPWREGLARTVEWFREHDDTDAAAPAGPHGRRVSVIGCGYLGAVHAASLARLGHDVVGIDVDEARVATLSAGRAPFYEPELVELLDEGRRAGRLRFSSDTTDVQGCDVHFVCVGTPQRAGSGEADLRHLDEAVECLLPHLRAGDLVVGKSTVPVGTAPRVADRVRARGADLVWNPEFLREGHAVADTLRPDRLVYGVGTGDAGRAAAARLDAVYAPLVESGVPRVVTDLATAELAKVAANAFLATKISFVNAMAEVCETSGGDAVALAGTMAYDPRIGGQYLGVGLGFGGGCLPKDIRAFLARARELGIGPAVEFLEHVDAINDRACTRAVARVRRACGGTLAGARVTVLGAAFKPESDDVRSSPALELAERLAEGGARAVVTDPQAVAHAQEHHPALGFQVDVDEALRAADVVVLATAWEEYVRLDPYRAGELVRHRRLVDTRNAVDPGPWRAAGWSVDGLGRPTGQISGVGPGSTGASSLAPPPAL
ncbi:nucleotide sugar dehydrogenase [Isoptericola sp. S6320L]|uniref:nucleotide sugar dehydrogenase n=1 Tax=Isoptericola sp. S6320L TaxID=2926411 RepID=UPI0027E3124B|nr:nucleotide sugar dehydrogenase [Isoptericola sp. S6320L]